MPFAALKGDIGHLHRNPLNFLLHAVEIRVAFGLGKVLGKRSGQLVDVAEHRLNLVNCAGNVAEDKRLVFKVCSGRVINL